MQKNIFRRRNLVEEKILKNLTYVQKFTKLTNWISGIFKIEFSAKCTKNARIKTNATTFKDGLYSASIKEEN